MRSTFLAFVVTTLAAGVASAEWTYPQTPVSDAADVWHGRRYPDPYRWLEDERADAVKRWFKAQADLTDGLLGRIPGRDALVKEWLALDARTPPRYGDLTVESGRVFYRKTLGGEAVGKVYFRDGWEAKEQLLFDPTTYAPGVKTVVQSFVPSWDGKHVVLALTANGAEWSELRVLRVDGRKLLPESIYPSWTAFGWLPDNQSFFYDAGDVTDVKRADIQLNRKTKLHHLGTKPGTDRDVFSNASAPDLGITPKELPFAQVLEVAPQWLVGTVSTVQSELRVYVAPAAELSKPRIAWRSLVQPSDGIVRSFVVHGPWVYGVSYTGAPHYKIVRTRLDAPDWKRAETVVPEAADTIELLGRSKDYGIVQYSNGVTGRVVKLDFATGATKELPLPAQGTVDLACPDAHGNRCVLTVTGWMAPATKYDVDLEHDTVVKSPFTTEVAYPELAGIVTEELEIPGHDGVMIPLSIMRPKDLKLDGSAPAILEGYGAYGVAYTPWFHLRNAVASHGVVMAYAHPRGGGEKGEAWYRGGFKSTKPNTWKDFEAAAQYLIAKGYTSAARLCGRGTSAGGILISRAITDRPDLFAAAVVNVGVANVLRAEQFANGPVNAPEFGTVNDPAEAAALFEMDGLQHVQPGSRYPAVLGVAGWNDPRVAVWQPAKFIAALQQASTSGKPVLLKVNYDNGHFTEDKAVTFRNFADQHAFCLWQAGHPEFQPTPLAKAP